MSQIRYSNSETEELDENHKTPSFDSLPNDIITNILFRLPPLFLYNSAMFVSKTWSQIISQSHSSSGLLIQDSRSPNKPTQFVHINNQSWDIIFSDYFNLNFPGKITGTTSNGVLLINNTNKGLLYVANPLTKQVLKLPILPSTCNLCGHCNNIASISSTGEIKVVSLARNPNGKYNWYVITLQNNNNNNNKAMSWRKISSNNDKDDPVSYLSFVQSVSTDDGVVFWTNSSWITNRSVLATDLHAKKVHSLKIPLQGGEYWTLVQMRGKMCLMNCGENVGIMKVWELKDLHRNEWVWVNSVRICDEGISALRSKFCVPIVWVDSQVIVMSVFVRDSNVVVAYHVRKGEYKVIKIGDVARHTIFYHKNSLRPF